MIHWLVVLLCLLGTTHEAIVGRGKYSFALWIVIIIIRIEHEVTSDKVLILVSQPRMGKFFPKIFRAKYYIPPQNFVPVRLWYRVYEECNLNLECSCALIIRAD